MIGPRLSEQLRLVTYPDGTRVAVLDAVVPDSAPAEIKNGLALRAYVNGGGVCACGARVVLPNRKARRAGRVKAILIEHDGDCPATTENLAAAMLAWRAAS